MSSNEKLQVMDLTPIQRKERVHQLRLKIPTHQHALRTLQYCLEGSAYSAEPKSLFIGGDSGMGKSTLIETFVARNPRRQQDYSDHIPVLAASIPSAATTKSTASSLLKAVGDPRAFNGELARLTDRLLTYLDACKVRMIVLDEFQHIIDRESSKLRAGTADWLKSIVNESGVPVALVGLPYSEVILDENVQLDRRFHTRIMIPRFTFDTSTSRASFRTMLKLLDDHMPFTISAGLDNPRTAEWLFKKSKGLLAGVMGIVRDAAELAIDQDAAKIEHGHLECAYEHNRSKILKSQNQTHDLKPKVRARRKPILGEVLRS